MLYPTTHASGIGEERVGVSTGKRPDITVKFFAASGKGITIISDARLNVYSHNSGKHLC